MDDRSLARLAKEVARYCLRGRQTLAVAESCTGGWIAKCLTDIPGSSTWFRGGVVSYSDAAKAEVLGVSVDLISEQGAVSEPVARAMAEGALRVIGADCALAVTGIAGPDGGTPVKPVGTVWLAWAGRGRPTRTTLYHFEGDRETIRRQAVACALEGLLLQGKNPPPAPPSGRRPQGGGR